MTVTVKGYSTLTGRPTTLLSLMREARVFDNQEGSQEDYIASVQQAAWRFFGIALQVTGTTAEERAESLLREMAAHNMITIDKE